MQYISTNFLRLFPVRKKGKPSRRQAGRLTFKTPLPLAPAPAATLAAASGAVAVSPIATVPFIPPAVSLAAAIPHGIVAPEAPEAIDLASSEPVRRPGKRPRVVRSLFLRPRADGVPDILDAIQDLGGIASPRQSRFADKGDYDGFSEALIGPARLLIRRAGGNRPDELVNALSDPTISIGQTWRLESTSDLYDAIYSAVQGREADRKQAERGLLDQRFYESALTNRPRREGCSTPIPAAQLKVGDKFKVARDQCEVRNLDADSFEVDISCSPRFGRQTIPDGASVFPDHCRVESTNGGTMKRNPVFGKRFRVMKGNPVKVQRSNVVRFNVLHDDGRRQALDFVPVANVPGFSHRIALDNQLTRHWLADEFTPTVKTASFFWEKIEAEKSKPNPQRRRHNPAGRMDFGGRYFFKRLRSIAVTDRLEAIRWLRANWGFSYTTAAKWTREVLDNEPWTYPPRRGQFTRYDNPAVGGDFFERPESVAEQKARLAAEDTRRLKARQREEMARRVSARITGRSVDTTGELFDPTAGGAPLFAVRKNPQRRSRIARNGERRRRNPVAERLAEWKRHNDLFNAGAAFAP